MTGPRTDALDLELADPKGSQIDGVTRLNRTINVLTDLAATFAEYKVPTAAPASNNNQIANTEFVKEALANLVDAAPGTLDTLNELANALGRDKDFATTMTNALASKLDKTEGMHVGTLGEGVDLDAITTAGSYRCTTTQLNVPDTGHGQLLVVRGGYDTIAQIYFPYSNANVWTRQGNPPQVGGPVGGFWRPWARLLNTHDPQIHTGPTQPVGMKNGDIWIEV